MRTVVPSREVPHLWAHQTQATARNANGTISFDGELCHSYRAVIGRLVRNNRGEQAVLVNSRTWSVTTSKHQSRMRGAVSHLTSFTVPEMGTHPEAHNLNLRHYRERVTLLDGAFPRARTRQDSLRDDRAAVVAEANCYCLFFDLAPAFLPGVLTERETQWEAERAERARLAAIETEKREQRERRDLAARRRRWLAGEQVDIWRHPDTFLRLVTRDNVPTVETSRGAAVPLAHARRLFDKFSRGILREGDKVGEYAVSEVGAASVRIGCHTVTVKEARRFFNSLAPEGA